MQNCCPLYYCTIFSEHFVTEGYPHASFLLQFKPVAMFLSEL